MRRYSFLLILTVAVVGTRTRQLKAQGHAADSVAILRIVHERAESMGKLNAELQGANYATNAVWINAFGGRQVGRDSIIAFLRGLYADPGYRESRVVRAEPPEVLFIRPDVAVVHEFHEREGQRLADGTVIARRTHTTLVVSKEQGRWLIQYQSIADERPRAVPR